MYASSPQVRCQVFSWEAYEQVTWVMFIPPSASWATQSQEGLHLEYGDVISFANAPEKSGRNVGNIHFVSMTFKLSGPFIQVTLFPIFTLKYILFMN